MERLLRFGEVREVLQISQPTLERMLGRGELPVVRVGDRGVRISERELVRYIQQRTERRGQ